MCVLLMLNGNRKKSKTKERQCLFSMGSSGMTIRNTHTHREV